MGNRLHECFEEKKRLEDLVESMRKSMDVKDARIDKLNKEILEYRDALNDLQQKYNLLKVDFALWQRVALKFMKLFGAK